MLAKESQFWIYEASVVELFKCGQLRFKGGNIASKVCLDNRVKQERQKSSDTMTAEGA